MATSEVVHIFDALDRVGVRFWLTGGWGVDALHGGATREHRDLDLAIDVDSFGMARGTLDGIGFIAETSLGSPCAWRWAVARRVG